MAATGGRPDGGARRGAIGPRDRVNPGAVPMALERADLRYVESLLKLAHQYRVERLRVGSVEILTAPESLKQRAPSDFAPIAHPGEPVCTCGHERPEHNQDGLCLLCHGQLCA